MGAVRTQLGDEAAAADVERPGSHVRLDGRGRRALDRAERLADVRDARRVDTSAVAPFQRERREVGRRAEHLHELRRVDLGLPELVAHGADVEQRRRTDRSTRCAPRLSASPKPSGPVYVGAGRAREVARLVDLPLGLRARARRT